MTAQVVAAFHKTDMRTYVDCTLGAGGHALAVASDHPELATLIGAPACMHACSGHKEAGICRWEQCLCSGQLTYGIGCPFIH